MSLHPTPIGAVPEQTAEIARAAFPKGNVYLRLRDELGTIFSDETFASLFPRRGQPAEAPWRLALVTLLQASEDLSDRAAADAVRSRLDWKYLLGLELSDPGFDHSVLCEFRSRLLAHGAEEQLLDVLLAACKAQRWLLAQGRQRTDSTHVLARVRVLNRLESIGESLRAALNVLAIAHPAWLRARVPAEWEERYGAPIEDFHRPKREGSRRAWAEEMGRDGHWLLAQLAAPDAPPALRLLPAVEVLRQVWVQQFSCRGETVRWRREDIEGLPPASVLIRSPSDPEARGAKKRSTAWIGYKVHVSETCDEAMPHLITHVETTAATLPDPAALEPVHKALQRQDLLPSVHLVDSGYVDAHTLVQSAKEGVDLLGPPLQDRQWQAKADQGFAQSDFTLDWEKKQATCPAGTKSRQWSKMKDATQHPVLRIKFSPVDCQACVHRGPCTRGAARTLTVRVQEEFQALQAAREREAGADFPAAYARRAGVEGTISQGVRAFHLREARYLGQAKTHLQHVAIAAAMNLVRLSAWLAGEDPATTRHSSFQKLMAQPAYG